MQVHLLLLCAPNPKKASNFLLLHVAPAGEPQLFFCYGEFHLFGRRFRSAKLVLPRPELAEFLL